MKGLFTLPEESGKADRMLEQGRQRKRPPFTKREESREEAGGTGSGSEFGSQR